MVRKFLTFIFKGKDWIENLPVSDVFLTSRYHWYNIVSPSPWPILIGITSFPGVIGLVGTMHGIISGLELFISSFLTFLFFFSMWNRDIIRESTFIGLHTKQVDKNTITGFKLFLFSEVMLFVTFFWAHLYSALYPSVFIGLSWPPVGLGHLLLDPFDIPLTNTLILVYSGFTVTVSHLYLRRGNIKLSGWAMFVTIILGLAFLYIQKEEFIHSEFDISDGIYGSTFFMLTGFHGGHVIIGVTGLIVTLIRLLELHFSSYSHTGFKLALIYWHFVDVVWIFVFLIIYVLGSDLVYPNAILFGDNTFPRGCIINVDAATFGKFNNPHEFYKYRKIRSYEATGLYRGWKMTLWKTKTPKAYLEWTDYDNPFKIKMNNRIYDGVIREKKDSYNTFNNHIIIKRHPPFVMTTTPWMNRLARFTVDDQNTMGILGTACFRTWFFLDLYSPIHRFNPFCRNYADVQLWSALLRYRGAPPTFDEIPDRVLKLNRKF